jgi:hypothetical protein
VIVRRAVVGIAVAVSALALSACGFQAPAVTEHEGNSIQAADLQVGQIRVRDVSVSTVATGGTQTAEYITATLVNDGPTQDQLTSITTPAGTVSLTGAGVFGGALTVPPRGVPVVITQPVLNPDGPSAQLAAATPPSLGSYLAVQFSFADAGSSASAQVPVVPPRQSTEAQVPVPLTPATPPPAEGRPASD